MWLNKVMIVVVVAMMIYKAYQRRHIKPAPIKPVAPAETKNEARTMAEHVAAVAGSLAVMGLEDNLRNGQVVTIPSIGLILTYRNLKNPEGATPPTIAKVVRALTECLIAQKHELDRTNDPERRAEIEKTMEDLYQGINDPSRYFLPVASD